MKYKVCLTKQAQIEADTAYEWIARDSKTYAYNWFNGLEKAVASLCRNPERCPSAPESEAVSLDVRQLLYAKFRVIFIIDNDSVHILHIRHSARRRLKKEDF